MRGCKTDDAYTGLANAIILQAVSDYRKVLKKLKKRPNDKEAMREAMKIESFFRSEYYQVLTSVDGEYLISKLREEASE